jgi:hypothetical protein
MLQPNVDKIWNFRVVPRAEHRAALAAVDYATMVSCFFPTASISVLNSACLLSIWLKLLAEQLESPSRAKAGRDSNYRGNSLGLLKGLVWSIIGLWNGSRDALVCKNLESPTYVTPYLPGTAFRGSSKKCYGRTDALLLRMRVGQLNPSFSFARFGYILSEPLTTANPDKARKFVYELDEYMKRHEDLTAAVVTGTIPTIEELGMMRMSDTGICGIGVLLATVWYALFSIARSKSLIISSHHLVPGHGESLDKIFDIPLVKAMCAEAKVIAWLTNDLTDFIYVNHGNYSEFIVTNSITALFKQSNCTSLQGAVNKVHRRLYESIDRFESRAKSLVGNTYDLPDGRQGEVTEAEAIVVRDILRNVFVGNLIWMDSRRVWEEGRL